MKALVASWPWAQLRLPRPWPQALRTLGLLLAVVCYLYRDTGLAMVAIWSRSDTFAHAFLVPPISLYLVWRRRHAVLAQTPQCALSAWPLVAAAVLAWVLGDLASINAVTQLAFTAMLVSLVPAVLGWRITRRLMFPLGFLFFAVPVGEFMMPQLMEWTANFTVFALRLSGIPVYREGLQFVIPSGHWSVVEACSGVRYLMASLTVGTLFAYLSYQSTARRLLFVLFSLLVPIVANWLRAYFIVMLGHLSDNQLATGVDHLVYGWLFFGVVILLMYLVGARWAQEEVVEPVPAAAVTAVVGVSSPRFAAQDARGWAQTAGLLCLLALPPLALQTVGAPATADLSRLAQAPALSVEWDLQRSTEEDFKPAFQNPSAEVRGRYVAPSGTVGLYLGYYQAQNYQHKLVSSDNVLLLSKDPHWVQVASAPRDGLWGAQTVSVRTAQLRPRPSANFRNETGLLVWQIYWINGRLTASDYQAKALIALNRLMGRGDASAVIVLHTAQGPGADALLHAYVNGNYAAINAWLEQPATTPTLKGL
jgi:exosortase A